MYSLPSVVRELLPVSATLHHLAWRLAILPRNSQSINHDKVLTAWYAERKQQLERSLAATIQDGAYVTESDPWKPFVRDWYLWAIQLVPGWKRDLEKGPRNDGMIRYRYQPGMPIFCLSIVERFDSRSFTALTLTVLRTHAKWHSPTT